MHLKSLLGADISNVSNIDEDYAWASSIGYSFVLADIFSNGDRILSDGIDSRSDEINGLNFLKIRDNKISNCVVGKISRWIDLDSDDEGFSRVSEKALIEEFQWAIFQGFPAVVITLRRKSNPNLSRVLSSFFLNEHAYFRVWISLQMEYESEFEELTENENLSSTWSWWKEFSSLMGEHISNIMLMLTLPKKISNETVLDKWIAEPVSAIKIPTDIFLKNRAGYPVLSVENQDLLYKFFKQNVQVVISGDVQNPRGYMGYYQYIAHLWKNRPALSIYEKNSRDMEDHLQDPLQPLADHLPSVTYSIFELDPYKYNAYEEAIYAAIMKTIGQEIPDEDADFISKYMNGDESIENKSNQDNEIVETVKDIGDVQDKVEDGLDEEDELEELDQTDVDKESTKSLYGSEIDRRSDECESVSKESDKLPTVTYASVLSGSIGSESNNCLHTEVLPEILPKEIKNKFNCVIMVLGAGRGPLVDCAFRASDRANCNVIMHIVEKNPNAVSFLRHRVRNDWNNRSNVTLHPGDMRSIKLPELADIFVSELLGSFGDNELSPECLDGAQHFLKPNGISIPTNYTSYIVPIQSIKLFNDMFNQKPARTARKSKFASLETPYVVNLRNYRTLSTIEPVFTFEHPKSDLSISNDRYKKIKFDMTEDCVIHGFAGYFDSVLYDDIHMSIHPDNHSPDMFSWFPILFPLLRPIQIKAGDCIELHMWRVSNTKAVWYEWAVTGDHILPVHNAAGRSYSMSLLSN